MDSNIRFFTDEEIKFFNNIIKCYEEKEKRKISVGELVNYAIRDDNYGLLEFLKYYKVTYRVNLLKNKLKQANFNPQKRGKLLSKKYTQEEDYNFKKRIEEYSNGEAIVIDKLFDIAIENEDWDFIEYLFYRDTKHEEEVIEAKIIRFKNF